MDLDEAASAFRAFVEVVRALRTPGTGCPWDLEQNHRTLRPYLIEEAHEVLEAIDRDDDRSLCGELGDLLLQVVLHAQIAADRGAFSIVPVVRGITQKMVRRHPHVFGSTQVSGSGEVVRNWEQIKAAERLAVGEAPRASALDGVPQHLPALHRGQRLVEKSRRAGLEGGTVEQALAQVRAGLDRLEAALGTSEQGERDLGDVLLSLCRLAGRADIPAEDSLRASIGRFLDSVQANESQGAGPPPVTATGQSEVGPSD